MATFYILCGIPGSGKSTWAVKNQSKYNFKIFSSDEYRKNLLGNINDQSKNGLVFERLYSDIVEYLKEGKNCCLDATNMTIKNRKFALDKLTNIECEKVCILFATPQEIALANNELRDRKVPSEVIDKMISSFEIPFTEEGFDRVEIVDWDCEHVYYMEEISKMRGVNQDNPHHKLHLDKHCLKCFFEVYDAFPDDYDLQVAALGHDVGKLYTRTYNANKHLSNYYNHENVGAYKALFLEYPTGVNRENVCFYINYHMYPYMFEKMKPQKAAMYKSIFGNRLEKLMVLHEADVKAH